MSSRACKKEFFDKRNAVDLWEWVYSETCFLDDTWTFIKRVQFLQQPSVPLCYCGNHRRIQSSWNQPAVFSAYCSDDCKRNDPRQSEIQKERAKKRNHAAANIKRRKTLLEKHGVEYNSQRPEIKKRLAAKYDRPSPHVKIENQPHSLIVEEIAEWLRLKEIQITFRDASSILLPDYNVGIEFNGLYWNSFGYVPAPAERSKHLQKTIDAAEQGIQLLHIFEDEWILKKDIWKSMILSKCGIYQQRIYARKCEKRQVPSKEAKTFFESNHLQGYSRGGYTYGLYYEDRLVAAVSVGSSRFKKGRQELYRFATLKDTQVVGGFSKLTADFDDIDTYADRRYSSGDVYSNWSHEGSTGLNYYYWKKGYVKINRYAAQKSKLPALLGEAYDSSLTEIENMIAAGYRILYDCGNLKFKK